VTKEHVLTEKSDDAVVAKANLVHHLNIDVLGSYVPGETNAGAERSLLPMLTRQRPRVFRLSSRLLQWNGAHPSHIVGEDSKARLS
jgi:hypothetical protein